MKLIVWFCLTLLIAPVLKAPSPGDIEKLLQQLLSDRKSVKSSAEARLTEIGRRFPQVLEKELINIRGKERFLSTILKVGSSERRKIEFFLKEKYEEALKLFKKHDYSKTSRFCESILTLGITGPLRYRVKQLLKLSRDREFSDKTLFVDLRSKKEVYDGEEQLDLVLEIKNRSHMTVDLNMPLGVQLEESVTTISSSGHIFGRDVTKDLGIEKKKISLAPGKSWDKDFLVERTESLNESFVIERITVKGRIVHAMIVSEGRRFDRTLSIPRVEVLRVTKGRAGVVERPLEKLKQAIKAEDRELIFLSTVLSVWDGKYEKVFELLLKATAVSKKIDNVCYILLRLLTGENYGTDRKKWIYYFLGREDLSVRSTLFDW